MAKKVKINKKKITSFFSVLLLIVILTSIIVNIKQYVPESEAAETNYGSITVTYSEGDIPRKTDTNTEEDTEGTILFDDITLTISKTISGTASLNGENFSDIVPTTKLDNNHTLDCETFYFDEEILEDSWSYSFTGWHIVGTDEYIPAVTCFQPGDTITPEVLEKYASSGTLELEAVWGKVYYIQNPYKNMVYSVQDSLWALDEVNSSGETGASNENIGNNPSKPKATIDGLYSSLRDELMSGDYGTYTTVNNNPNCYDAYHTVVMLTGELDYYKDSNASSKNYYGYAESSGEITANSGRYIYVSATYKSFQKDGKGTVYNYNYKPKGYYNTIYANLRFDNINLKAITISEDLFYGQSIGGEFQLMLQSYHTGTTYFEITARYSGDAFSTFRPDQTEYVVLNGGSISGWQNTYGTAISTGKTLNWYMGRNANISTAITCGVTSTNASNLATVYNNYNLYITGGSVKEIRGGNAGSYSISVGNRNIYIYGDQGSNSKTNPTITTIYGGSYQGRLYGDVNINIKGATDIKNLYGGGYYYTATTYGNINISIEKSTITGNIFGGGYNGNVEITPSTYDKYSASGDDYIATETNISDLVSDSFVTSRIGNGGDVTLSVTESEVYGNIFGSGTGQTQNVETQTYSKSYSNSSYNWFDATEDGTFNGTYYEEDWEKMLTDYPYYDSSSGQICVNARKAISWTNNTPTNITFYVYRTYYYLSLATVQNVDILIDGSVIGTSDSRR